MENQNQNQAPAQEVPENLTPQQALAILVQGVQFAQTKGIYSLTDAELISKAVRVFTNTPEEGKEADADALVAEAEAEAPAPAPSEDTAPVMEVVSEEVPVEASADENTSSPA